jgi:cytochrome o ubiquinol oxidase operon protein cyoD
MSVAKKSHIKTAIITYSIGFVLSIALTLLAFMFVGEHVSSHHAAFSHEALRAIIMIFAVVQFVVQLAFFLHLGQEERPRWNLIVFLFMMLVLVIIVAGSLWIMDNLNYHMMTPTETKAYMKDHEGL